ncbi:transposase-like zinc-binding domain-containing protein [Thioclava atlantica]|uniref:IS1/IS1595 family N-terminal zinc-binding domain-containing protein n=1 Tax=Thioclava atlantica TaxID=1317124 RepID=UPI0012E0C2A4|nr:hypothetical protein [Thioclava atlantica]
MALFVFGINGQYYSASRKKPKLHQHEFIQFLTHFDLLAPAQIEKARARISDVRRRNEALAQIEGGGARECPRCGSGKRLRWDKMRTNVQRYRCGSCKKTFTGRNGTRIAHIHRPGLFFDRSGSGCTTDEAYDPKKDEPDWNPEKNTQQVKSQRPKRVDVFADIHS